LDPLLAGRRVLVTGGASGIGAGVVDRFEELGARCAVLDLTPARASSGAIDRPLFVADVTDEEAVRKAVTAATAALGGLDGVVAAAGVVPRWQRPAELDLADFDRVLAINVRGVAAIIKHTTPLLGSGATIVAVASVNSWKGDPNIASYVASKHAVLGLVRSAALALGPGGVRVNCVGPGPIATEALQARMAARAARTGLDVADALWAAAESTALRRLATVDDVANTIAFLTSPLSAGITGQLVAVDGGIL